MSKNPQNNPQVAGIEQTRSDLHKEVAREVSTGELDQGAADFANAVIDSAADEAEAEITGSQPGDDDELAEALAEALGDDPDMDDDEDDDQE